MRNIYYSYRLCKFVLNNSEVHVCSDKDKCLAYGEAGTFKDPNAKKVSKAIKKYKGKKPEDGDISEFVRDLRFAGFASNRGFIENNWCEQDDASFMAVTDLGIELTDTFFMPFTPIGLWKAIYEEHKVFSRLVVTAVTTVVVSASGVVLAYSWSLIKGLLGLS